MTAALDLANAFLDAWVGQDFETAGSFLADDFRFDGPIAHYRSANEFLEGSRAFASMLVPQRSAIAGFGDDREALLLYDLHLTSGAPMRIADYLTVADGKITSEQILFDTGGLR